MSRPTSLRARLAPLAAAALLAFPALLASCEEVPELPIKDRCDGTADCPLGQVCDKLASKCIPEPSGTVLGDFSCAGVDAQGKGYPQGRIGTSEVMGYITLPKSMVDENESPDRKVSLVAKSTCVVTDTHVILLAQDPAEALAEDADSYQLSVYIPIASITPNTPVDIEGALLERYVDADRAYRNYSITKAGKVVFQAVPAVGKLTRGYLSVNELNVCEPSEPNCCPFEVDPAKPFECKRPVEIPPIDYPDEADTSDNIGEDDNPDQGDAGAGGEGQGGEGQGGEGQAGEGQGGEGGEGQGGEGQAGDGAGGEGAGGDGAGGEGAGGDGAGGDGAGGDGAGGEAGSEPF